MPDLYYKTFDDKFLLYFMTSNDAQSINVYIYKNNSRTENLLPIWSLLKCHRQQTYNSVNFDINRRKGQEGSSVSH